MSLPSPRPSTKRKVVGLLYLLIRDEMPFGALAQLLRQMTIPQDLPYLDDNILKAAEDVYEKYIA